jgi:hypothetical protein
LIVRTRAHRLGIAAAVVAVAGSLAAAPSAVAAGPCLVGPGYDLFQTRQGTQFDVLTAVDHALPGVLPPDLQSGTVVGFRGVPLGQYAFPGAGTFETGTTDTIVRRFGEATPTSPVIPIELVSLQLQANSVAGVLNGDAPVFVTLQSDRGRNASDPAPGPRSTGTLTVQFNPDCQSGTLSSSIDVYFDIRVGSVDGPIVTPYPSIHPQGETGPLDLQHLSLGAVGTPWDRIDFVQHKVDEYEQAGMTWHKVVGPAKLIPGINQNLPEGDFQAGSI